MILHNVTLVKCDYHPCSAQIIFQGPRKGGVLIEVESQVKHGWQVMENGDSNRLHYCPRHHQKLVSENEPEPVESPPKKTLDLRDRGKGY